MAVKKEQIKGKIIEIMGATANTFDVSKKIFHLLHELTNEEDINELFCYVLTNFGDTPKSGVKLIKEYDLEDESLEQITSELMDYVTGKLKYLVFKRYKPEEFSKHIWDFVNSFSNDDEKVICLAIIILDDRIPYVQLPGPGIVMIDEKREILYKELKKEVDTIRMIIYSGINDIPEMASLINLILDSQDNNENKAILLAYSLLEFCDYKKD